jgi:hypothetical protein
MQISVCMYTLDTVLALTFLRGQKWKMASMKEHLGPSYDEI